MGTSKRKRTTVNRFKQTKSDKFLHTTLHGVVQFGNILQLHEIVKWWHNIAQDLNTKTECILGF